MTRSTAQVLAYALTGATVRLPEGASDPSALLRELDKVGWTADLIRDHAATLRAAEQPWPHPIPQDWMEGIGAARWYAALLEARRLLRIDTIQEPPSRRTQLTRDEQRLLEDAPPHHGNVG